MYILKGANESKAHSRKRGSQFLLYYQHGCLPKKRENWGEKSVSKKISDIHGSVYIKSHFHRARIIERKFSSNLNKSNIVAGETNGDKKRRTKHYEPRLCAQFGNGNEKQWATLTNETPKVRENEKKKKILEAWNEREKNWTQTKVSKVQKGKRKKNRNWRKWLYRIESKNEESRETPTCSKTKLCWIVKTKKDKQ